LDESQNVRVLRAACGDIEFAIETLLSG
jgi:hypothetical protein